ncbi:RCKP-type rubredoxin-like domain-containing protein [Desulfuribacillus alkaliarsenatis]
MAIWKCSKCGFTKDSRCRPGKCPECGAAKDDFKKDE